MGGSYEVLELDSKGAISMGNRLALKIHDNGEGAARTRRHVFVLKVGTEKRITIFLKRYAGGKRISRSSR